MEESLLSGSSTLCGEFSSADATLKWLPLPLSIENVVGVSDFRLSSFRHVFSLRQQKARDNRAAQRISKVQLSNDPVKRQQATQPPLPAPYEPAPMEGEGGFKDPLRSKESEQEQEWKLRQVSSAVPHFQTRPRTQKSTPVHVPKPVKLSSVVEYLHGF